MDTKTFNQLTEEEYKKQTQKHWSKSPCGSNYGKAEYLTKEYFDEVEKHRYGTHPWILKNIQSFDIKDKKVLEIGYGMGTDHLNLARQGGIMHGIDLTPGNLGITGKRMALYGLNSELTTGDAENLPFPDNHFDFVYSFGVIHHSPDTKKIISEIHRVLKPGGKFWITVYHKNSLFFWWTVFFTDWIARLNFRKETIQNRISRIEHPNDNPNLVIRLYTRKEFESMFSDFQAVKTSVDHLIEEDISYFGQYLSKSLLNRLAKRYGWYVIAEGVKAP
jgi:ubiquinone/menaquinone biosynthesis C-methylase UbiE